MPQLGMGSIRNDFGDRKMREWIAAGSCRGRRLVYWFIPNTSSKPPGRDKRTGTGPGVSNRVVGKEVQDRPNYLGVLQQALWKRVKENEKAKERMRLLRKRFPIFYREYEKEYRHANRDKIEGD